MKAGVARGKGRVAASAKIWRLLGGIGAHFHHDDTSYACLTTSCICVCMLQSICPVHYRRDTDSLCRTFEVKQVEGNDMVRAAYAETSAASLPWESRPTTASQPPTCFWSVCSLLTVMPDARVCVQNPLMKMLGTVR